MRRLKIGMIGFGRMGGLHLRELLKNDKWEVSYICDISQECREDAARLAPDARIVSDATIIFEDPEVDAVGLYALADSRLDQIGRAVRYGKHIIAEKPVSDTIENEWEAVRLAETPNILSTVNLYLRNSWYHKEIRDFVRSGEIGDLAIIRVCHLTPGLAPGEGHEYEGPSFHDCGMHYVDIARWYAGSEYKTMHSQGVRMWSYKDPWFLQAHGTFENGVVFDITQGHVYGQLSKNQTHNTYIDIIGTKGIARMHHDFKTAYVDLHGVNETLHIERPYGEKNIDVLIDRFADSIVAGRLSADLPTFRDAAIASEFAWKCLRNSAANGEPKIGTLEELDLIHERRRNMKNGYGLLHQRKENLEN